MKTACVGVVLCLIYAIPGNPLLCEAQAQAAAPNQPGLDRTESGARLFHSCQASIRSMDSPKVSEGDLRDEGFCLGYFRGFGDYNAMNSGSSICLDNATTGTIIRVYVAFMEKNPKNLDEEMIFGAIYALKETYPCKDPKSQ